MNIRIAIFDSSKNTRDQIVKLLSQNIEFQVVGLFSTLHNCKLEVLSAKPDVILMDIEMPRADGIESLKLLHQEFPQAQILIQTAADDDQRVFGSLCAGASGYILKQYLESGLIDSIRQMRMGGSPLSPAIANSVLRMIRQGKHHKQRSAEDYQLTRREKEVLRSIVDGNNYKMVGDQLNISYETVRSHVKKLYKKMNAASLNEVVAKAIYQNVV